MNTYEYKTVVTKRVRTLLKLGEIDYEKHTRQLNVLGMDGWELVNSYPASSINGSTTELVSILKRRTNLIPKTIKII